MGQSYRIRTEVGIDKTIDVLLEQDFEFLEILSLKIQQEDIYNRNCADYGVVVGRVTANNGFGLPNARVSIFIPISDIDQSNPIISSIYPYKSPSDKNSDGYRYNLLPYEASYSGHSATGTLPTRLDVLTGTTAVEIYDKYYKFTCKTNDSGDYMIMGVPTGQQTLVMDVDLSDIGEFSLTPQDLIRMGLASQAQVAGNRFRTSTDLNSLPQIVNSVKNLEVSPLWGDPTTCQIAINRVDFDLRDNANIDIQPTAVFMGSIFSTTDDYRLRKNCKPRDDMGNLCSLITSPGQIIAIRQTIDQDDEGNPVLETYQLEQSGNVIDGDGTWVTELPMNLDYFTTNEFGERVVSYDPTIGIPTKAKYRFKVKWTQPPDLSQSVRRPYYLLPNVKEAGWDANGTVDPYLFPTVETQKKLASSYYFGLAWSGYTDGYSGVQKTQRLNEVINCEDTFYEFGFNRVYSPSLLIDEFKKGSRGQFIGIKEIDDSSCNSSINKFPVNEGVRNFDLIYFLFSILMQIFQVVGLVLLYVAHILIFLYSIVIDVICWIKKTFNPGFLKSFNCTKRDFTFKLPMITYPDCQACDCTSDLNSIPYQPPADVIGTGALSYLSQPALYRPTLLGGVYSADTTNGDEYAVMTAEALAGFAGLAFQSDFQRYKLPISSPVLVDKGSGVFWWRLQSSKNLPLGERINLFNQRSNFFTGQNKIKVTFAKNQNIGKFHYDNTLTVLLRNGAELNPGDLISFVSLESSTDLNYTYTALTSTGITKGISGQTLHTLSSTPSVNVKYATAQYSSLNVSYTLPYGTDNDKYKFPSDIEYYQVVTAITISNAISVWNTGTTQSFPNLINTPSAVNMFEYQYGSNEGWYLFADSSKLVINPLEQFENYGDQTILILQRGVDPYSPKYVNEYDTSILFGQPLGTPGFVFTAETRLNVPIQPLPSTTTISVQSLSNQADFSFNSYFFSPGIPGSTTPGLQYSAYSTTNLAYYGNLDSSQSPSIYWNISGNKVVSKTSNGFYLSTPNASKYDNSEDVSGMGIMSIFDYSAKTTDSRFTTGLNNMPSALKGYYTSSSYFPLPLNMGNNFSVVRTDRLPTSDKLDGLGATLGPGLNNVMLQQNLNFAIYVVSEEGVTVNGISNTTGADIVTPDLEGLPNDIRVLESFNCESMVGLGCYQGFGDNFSINQNCTQEDPVENGCYVMLKRPIVDLRKDVKTFAEWGYRFRFFYGLCRGVLSQTFTNNWINGGLYMFPIQVDTFYDKKNKPEYPIFCYDTVYFDINTNNFYYRSSPYNVPNKKFVGNRRTGVEYVPTASNDRNLMYPTTIINLGFKDSIYSNLTFNPETNSYIIPQLNPTSYADVSDLINLFVISRITDESFLQQIVSGANDSIGQLFSRPLNSIRQRKRVDGDLVQLLSINSEIGNINFSPQFYETPPNGGPPTTILGTAGDPTIAVWFSSTTQDLQTKDYLTPGRINFRSADNTYYYPYPYGIKTQVVPFYQWRLSNTDTIFGNQYNNWATKDYDIVQGKGYQSLDRTNLTTPNYFRPSTSSVNDLYARGYIFSVDANGNYSQTGATSDTFIVGAPFQFYFGINKGQSALDKFKTKYSVVE